MAEWSVHWTRNPVVLGLSSALTTTWICVMVAPSSNRCPGLWIADWFASGLLGFCYVQFNYLF